MNYDYGQNILEIFMKSNLFRINLEILWLLFKYLQVLSNIWIEISAVFSVFVLKLTLDKISNSLFLNFDKKQKVNNLTFKNCNRYL